MVSYGQMIEAQAQKKKFLCVGLDPVLEKIPQSIKVGNARETFVQFSKEMVDATKDVAACYKPNLAFFEGIGSAGFEALKEITAYIHAVAPGVPVLGDAKRADIGSTNVGYVQSIFDYLGMDAVTIQPYLGREAVQPFLDCAEKGIYVLARTSNPGSGEFQDLLVDGEPLYLAVARNVAATWNDNQNVGLVTGATYPEELARVRLVAPNLPFLIPGVGTQGGDLAKSVLAARDAQGKGFLISVTRDIIYASSGADFAEAARAKAQQYHSEIVALLV